MDLLGEDPTVIDRTVDMVNRPEPAVIDKILWTRRRTTSSSAIPWASSRSNRNEAAPERTSPAASEHNRVNALHRPGPLQGY
jgi:hypothetical protein